MPSACPYPKHTGVIWKKCEQCIDITQPKYYGSSVGGDSPVLCINNTKEEDGGVYTIEVHNELGKGTSSEELFVTGGKIRYTAS